MDDYGCIGNVEQASLLAQKDNLDDFRRSGSSDTIHCEYETCSPKLYSASSRCISSYNKINNWKLYRPSCAMSFCKSTTCSFFATVLGGVFVGMVSTAIMWLDINTAGVCFGYKNKWYDVPVYIQRIRVTARVLEGLVIQLWSFMVFIAVFGWLLMKQLNLLFWNMLLSFIGGFYILFLYVFGKNNETWNAYPVNILFVIITSFNSYIIASFYRQTIKSRLSLAIKLGGQFYLGFPIVMFFNYFIVPFYKTQTESNQAIIASCVPVLVVIPKIVERALAGRLQGINHPGTSGMLLIVLYIGAANTRVLQAALHDFRLYVLLCVIHGLGGAIDKLTLPLQDYVLKRCFKCQQHSFSSQFRSPRANRLLGDLALLSVILESSSIFVNCATVQIFLYYYGRIKGKRFNGYVLFKDFLWRVAVGIFIEWFFNALAIKLQTYYYNIPVIRVWKRRWRWIMLVVILNAIIAMMFFSEHLFTAVRSKDVLINPTVRRKCVGPFERP